MSEKTAVGAGKRSPLWKRLLPLAFLVAVLIAFFATGLNDYATFDTLKENRETLLTFVRDYFVIAILIYVLGYAFLTAASVPVASLVTIAGGFLFGSYLGTFLTVLAATIGATVLFLLARTAFGEALQERVGPYIRRMEEGFQEDQVNYMLFLRLVPVFPFWVVNLAPAFLGVSTRVFAITTFIGIIPGTAVFTIVGSGLGSVFDRGESFSIDSVLTPEILAALAGLGILALVPIVVKKLRKRRAASSQ
ncbi:MAG: TVP38/TMEM64 family protein [Pseudomonadota bacterium]